MNPTTNPLTIFQNQEFGKIRVEIINQEPMFVLKDICRALEIQNVSQCRGRLNPKGVCSTYTLTPGGPQQITVITESNLYKCIFQSRTEAAERFQDWVCEEVIPSIRRTGSYTAGVDTAALLHAMEINNRLFDQVNTLQIELRQMVNYATKLRRTIDKLI